MVTALVDGVLIDGNGGPARPGSTLVIDGGTIVEVSQQRELGSEVRVVELAGRTIVPGLIDCHAHFAHWGMNLIAHQDKSLMLLAAETVAALRTTLEAGCTTARDLGGLDGGFRDAVARGLIAGPRLQCSLIVVSPTNGIVDPTTAQGLPSPAVPGTNRKAIASLILSAVSCAMPAWSVRSAAAAASASASANNPAPSRVSAPANRSRAASACSR